MGSLGYVLPNPRIWAANAKIKAPYLRADVSDAVALLSAPPMFIGQQASPTSAGAGADAPVNLDTEIYDNAFGHLDTTNPDKYYGQFAGWYLAQGTCGIDYFGGSGALKAGIGLSASGNPLATYYGQRLPTSGTSPRVPQPAVAKLILFSTVGAHGGSNDYASLVVNQTSGASQNTHSGTSQIPQLQLQWVCAASGTPGLAVPVNASWPTPPAYITSAFLITNITNAVNFLIYPPVMEAFYQAGTQSLASGSGPPGTGTPVNLDTIAFDNYGAFNTSTHTWTVPANCGGVYWCYGQAEINVAGTCQAVAAGLTVTSANYNGGTAVTLWGGAQAAFAGGENCAIVRRRLRLNAGDTVKLAAFQHDSAAAAATLDYNTGGGFSVNESRLITVWRAA
jgi:hypothetical protein